MLAGFPQTPKSFSRHLRGSRHLPRRLRRLSKLRRICRDVCAGCAGFPAFAETFAQAARGSRHLPRRLRRLRGVPGICRDVCAGCARLPAFAETFAGLPQTPKSSSKHLRKFRKTPKNSPRHLRKFRKHQKALRDACGSSANAKKFSEAFETRPTAISPTKIGLPSAATGADKTK